MKYLILLLVIITPVVTTFADSEWELVTNNQGIKVWTREKAGSAVKEVMTSGAVDAPSWRVLKVVTDLDGYANFMPHTKESRILEKEGNEALFYTRVAPPLISDRDYTLKIVSTRIEGRERDFLIRFEQANDRGPATIKGVVRVDVVRGYWQLETKNEGATLLTYYVFTEPGGSVPDGLANKANVQSVPAIIKAVRERVLLKQYECQDGEGSDCEDWKAIAE